jgi:branched-chain amino acid transport system substrate-binding protein
MSKPVHDISRREVLAGTAAAGAALSLGSLDSARAAAQPVKIGYSMPRTGYLGVACPVAFQAYELWRQQVNAKGGLKIAGSDPRPIEFVTYDDQSEPTQAAQIYEKMITQDNVDLLLGPYGTPFHIALAPVIEKHKFPVVAATALSALLRDLKVRYMWFSQPLPDAYARTITDFMQSIDVKTVSMLTLQLPASLETKKYLTPLLPKANISVGVNEEYPPSVTDMTGMLSEVKNAKPDAVLALSYPLDSVLYVSTAREVGATAKMQLMLIGPTEPFFAQKFSKADLEGIMTIGEWSPKQSRWSGAMEFNDAYIAMWKEPPDYLDSVMSYAACQILEQAVAKVGLDHEKIRAAISSNTFDTIKGPIRFDGVVNATSVPGLLQIQDGNIEIVWPKAIATADFKPKKPWL